MKFEKAQSAVQRAEDQVGRHTREAEVLGDRPDTLRYAQFLIICFICCKETLLIRQSPRFGVITRG